MSRIVFVNIDDKPATIPRRLYSEVRADVGGSAPIADGRVSALEYVVAAHHAGGVCNYHFPTSDLLSDALSRFPVVAMCGGYAVTKGAPRGHSSMTTHNPTPLTLTHYENIVNYFKREAEILQVVIVGLDTVGASISLIATMGLTTRYKLVDLVEQQVAYSLEDKDYHQPVVMRGLSNDEILEKVLTPWLKMGPISADVVKIDKHGTVQVAMIGDETVADPLIHPTAVLKDIRQQYPVLPRIFEDEGFKAYFRDRQSKLCRDIQTVYDTTVYKSQQLSVTQMKLFHLLHILGVYYGKSISDLLVNSKTLDLCAAPGNMSVLMANLGAATSIHTNDRRELNHPLITRNTTINPILETGDHDWSNNFAADDNRKYWIVVSDGWSGVMIDSVNLFWAQVHVAAHKVMEGGSLIIKCFNTFDELFPDTTSIPAVITDMGKIQKGTQFKLGVFGHFAHWCIYKPAGSSGDNSEYYFMFMGFRVLPMLDDKFGRESLRRAYCRSMHALQSVVQTQYVMYTSPKSKFALENAPLVFLQKWPHTPVSTPIYNDVPVSIVMGSMFKRPQLQRLCSHTNIAMGIQLWAAKHFFYTVELQTDTLEEVKGPAAIHRIEMRQGRYDYVENFMRWATCLSDCNTKEFINYKGFMNELVLSYGIVSKLRTTYSSSGPEQQKNWRATVFWDDAPMNNPICAALNKQLFQSSYVKNKKIAEHTAYKHVVEKLIGCVITEAVDTPLSATDRIHRADGKSLHEYVWEYSKIKGAQASESLAFNSGFEFVPYVQLSCLIGELNCKISYKVASPPQHSTERQLSDVCVTDADSVVRQLCTVAEQPVNSVTRFIKIATATIGLTTEQIRQQLIDTLGVTLPLDELAGLIEGVCWTADLDGVRLHFS